MAKKELSQLYYLNREIEQQKKRLKELEEAASSCNGKITGMPHGPGVSNIVCNYATEIADLKALIELNIQKCWYEFNRLNRYIQSIDDSLMRQIFRLRYISGLTWSQIAYSIGGGNTGDSVRKQHDRFLKKANRPYQCYGNGGAEDESESVPILRK